MRRTLALLPALALLAACDSGNNLLQRSDLSAWMDAVEDPGRDLRRDVDRDTAPWDAGSEDEGTGDDVAATDPGRDEAPADPGPTDPGPKDPGTDPGATEGAVRLVTDKAALSTIVALVNGAQSSLQMVELEFPPGWAPDQVGVALASAVKRGVKVQVLIENADEVADNAPRLEVLLASGVDAKMNSGSRTLHTKLVVADRTKALVGSSNLSISALNYNHEANVALEGAALVEPYADYADRLWASQSKAVTIPATTVQGVTPMGDGQYPAVVLPHIQAARNRAWLLLYDLGDDWTGDTGDLADGLLAAKARGVDVRVCLEVGSYADVETANRNSGARLTAGGVTVRYDPTGTVTHAKLLVLDDAVAIYSGNWVYTGLNTNHEAGAFVNRADVAAAAATYFDGVWAQSTP
jgi:cardiolipin synthase A/B